MPTVSRYAVSTVPTQFAMRKPVLALSPLRGRIERTQPRGTFTFSPVEIILVSPGSSTTVSAEHTSAPASQI